MDEKLQAFETLASRFGRFTPQEEGVGNAPELISIEKRNFGCPGQ
jgi:hypothetical protein